MLCASSEKEKHAGRHVWHLDALLWLRDSGAEAVDYQLLPDSGAEAVYYQLLRDSGAEAVDYQFWSFVSTNSRSPKLVWFEGSTLNAGHCYQTMTRIQQGQGKHAKR